MGSIVGTVGAKAGLRFPQGTATLPVGTSSVIFTQILMPSYALQTATQTYLYVPAEYGWRAFTFQLVPATGFAGTISAAVNVTLDQGTASGLAATANSSNMLWEALPFPSVGTGSPSWTNPMTLTAGQRLLFANSGPWAAFEVVFTVTGTAPTGYILFGAGS